MNDAFVIFGLEKFPNSNLRVFNRWGQEIYTNDNYDQSWNGSGHPDGTYYFILTLTNEYKKQGYLTLVR